MFVAAIGGVMPMFSADAVIGGTAYGGQGPDPTFGTFPQLRIYLRNLIADVRATCVIALP